MTILLSTYTIMFRLGNNKIDFQLHPFLYLQLKLTHAEVNLNTKIEFLFNFIPDVYDCQSGVSHLPSSGELCRLVIIFACN